VNSQDADLTESQESKAISPRVCPYCNQELSPWEQVLLTVDRLLICRNCRRRIMLGVADISEKPQI
jgi:hypothetical protein